MLKTIQVDEELSVEELRESLIKLARARLTKKQRDLLLFLSEQNLGSINVTRLVPIIAGHLKCAPSTTWATLNVLKTTCLVEFGDLESKGKPVRLTKVGLLLSGHLQKV